MNATTQGISPQQYLDRVRAALGDLPTDEREELLEDLPAHLADVEAEHAGALEQRLGTPEEYATELRQSAGLAPAGAAKAPMGLTGRVSRRLAALSAELDDIPAWRRFHGFAPLLQPGWWVLRGYVAALVIGSVFAGLDVSGLVPEFGRDLLYFVPLAIGLIWVSVWLGQRGRDHNGWRRRAIWAANVVVVLLILGFAAQSRIDQVSYVGPQASVIQAPTDVYAYDSEGRLLNDVQLFDQYGNPLVLPGAGVPWQRADGSTAENVYPRGLNQAPRYDPSGPLPTMPPNVPPLLPRDAQPTAPPSPSANPSDSPSPTTPAPTPTR
jgi:hypothetical protein